MHLPPPNVYSAYCLENAAEGVVVSETTYPIRTHWQQLFYRTTSLEPNFFEAAYATRGKTP